MPPATNSSAAAVKVNHSSITPSSIGPSLHSVVPPPQSIALPLGLAHSVARRRPSRQSVTLFCLIHSGSSPAKYSGGGGYGRDRRTSLGVHVRCGRAVLRTRCGLRLARAGAGPPVRTTP